MKLLRSPFTWLALAVVLLVLPALHRVREIIVVDGCLDRGGAFDYSREQCVTRTDGPLSFPVIPYERRYPDGPPGARIAWPGSLLCLGIAVTVLFRRGNMPAVSSGSGG
jgi:hypothetical protein